MANEKFLQRLRSGDRPHGNRSTVTDAIADQVAAVVEPGSHFVGVEPIGRHVLMDRMRDEEKAAITRQFMNTPVYPSTADARARSLHLGKSRGGKTLRHPMAG